jgi:hypothetical protein
LSNAAKALDFAAPSGTQVRGESLWRGACGLTVAVVALVRAASLMPDRGVACAYAGQRPAEYRYCASQRSSDCRCVKLRSPASLGVCFIWKRICFILTNLRRSYGPKGQSALLHPCRDQMESPTPSQLSISLQETAQKSNLTAKPVLPGTAANRPPPHKAAPRSTILQHAVNQRAQQPETVNVYVTEGDGTVCYPRGVPS